MWRYWSHAFGKPYHEVFGERWPVATKTEAQVMLDLEMGMEEIGVAARGRILRWAVERWSDPHSRETRPPPIDDGQAEIADAEEDDDAYKIVLGALDRFDGIETVRPDEAAVLDAATFVLDALGKDRLTRFLQQFAPSVAPDNPHAHLLWRELERQVGFTYGTTE